MNTPFQMGQQDGQWTEERIRESGFNSKEDCLNHQEKVFVKQLAGLPGLQRRNPEYAKKQGEYLEGLMSATRQSLR